MNKCKPGCFVVESSDHAKATTGALLLSILCIASSSMRNWQRAGNGKALLTGTLAGVKNMDLFLANPKPNQDLVTKRWMGPQGAVHSATTNGALKKSWGNLEAFSHSHLLVSTKISE